MKYDVSNGEPSNFKELFLFNYIVYNLNILLGIVLEYQRNWKWDSGYLNGIFDVFPPTMSFLTHREHSIGLFSNTKGIGTKVIGSLNGKFDAFSTTKPY